MTAKIINKNDLEIIIFHEYDSNPYRFKSDKVTLKVRVTTDSTISQLDIKLVIDTNVNSIAFFENRSQSIEFKFTDVQNNQILEFDIYYITKHSSANTLRNHDIATKLFAKKSQDSDYMSPKDNLLIHPEIQVA